LPFISHSQSRIIAALAILASALLAHRAHAKTEPQPTRPVLANPRVTDAQWWLEAAHEEADLGKNKEVRSKYYLKLCAIAVRAQRFDKAKLWIDNVTLYYRELAWSEVAREYARLGKPQEAMDSIANMTDPAIRDKALVNVIIALAKNDKNTEAQAAIEKIYDARQRLIAKDTEAGVRAMQLGLEGSPEAALKVVMETKDPDRQVGAVRRIVWWIGKQNQPKRAVPFLAALNDGGVRDILISGLAEGLGEAGNVAEAMDRVETINDKNIQSYTYAQLAETFARVGKAQEAHAAIKKIQEIQADTEPGLLRCMTTLRLAEATWAAGDKVKAAALWEKAYEDGEEDRVWRDIRLEEIGKSQIDVLALDNAWVTAMKAKEQARTTLIESISRENVLANGQQLVLTHLSQLTTPEDRIALYVGAISAFFPDKEFQGQALKPEIKAAPQPAAAAKPKAPPSPPPAKKTGSGKGAKSGDKLSDK
jgi:tetratricopeptide (TPR) repeat protein